MFDLADHPIKGSFPALVTPFKGGKVDKDAIKRLLDWHIAEGTHGFVPVGTTGESPTLSHKEHDEVIKLVVEHVDGQVPVIAGACSNNTAEAIRLARHASVVGADAALVIAPYYNKPTQEGLYQNFKAIHDATDLPLVLYNVPGRAVVDISVETIDRLVKDCPRIIGVKDATADLARPALQAAASGPEFIQLSGEDATALAFNACGGVGCISVTANVAPSLCAQMQEATHAADFNAAREINARLVPLHKALFSETSPAPAKYALAELGRISGELRLPMVCVGEATASEVAGAMRHAGLIN